MAISRSSRVVQLLGIAEQQPGAAILDAVAVHHVAGQRRDPAGAGLDELQVRLGAVEPVYPPSGMNEISQPPSSDM